MSDEETVAQEFTIRVNHEPDHYWAEVLELPGCFASGETLNELAEALTEAIALYLDRPLPSSPAEVGELKLLVPA
jgi:predicted RNase H-like HicB family nuclease